MARRWAAPSSTAANFPWRQHARRFPMFNEPDASYHGLVYTEHFGGPPISRAAAASISARPARCCRRCRAFLLLQGIETVALRVERHVENARRVAEFLRARSAGRMGQLRRLRRQPLSRAGAKISRRPGLLAADLRHRRRARGRQATSTTRCDLFKRLVNMGDAKSLACHPASTTHRQMSAEEQQQSRRAAGNDPAQRRHRAYRRHHRRSRSGAGGIAARALGDDRGRIGGRRRAASDAAFRGYRAIGRRRRTQRAELHHHRPGQQHAGRGARSDRAAIQRVCIRAAAPKPSCCLKLFVMPELPRGEATRRALAGRYRDIAELWNTRLDGLIVTGTEPRAQNLTDEPYWPTLTHARRLGARPYRFDNLVVSCRACRRAASRRHRTSRA